MNKHLDEIFRQKYTEAVSRGLLFEYDVRKICEALLEEAAKERGNVDVATLKELFREKADYAEFLGGDMSAMPLTMGEQRFIEVVTALRNAKHQRPSNEDISGIVYLFAGWLTSRDSTLTVGATHWAAPMADAVVEFLKEKGVELGQPNFNVLDAPTSDATQDAQEEVCECDAPAYPTDSHDFLYCERCGRRIVVKGGE